MNDSSSSSTNNYDVSPAASKGTAHARLAPRELYTFDKDLDLKIRTPGIPTANIQSIIADGDIQIVRKPDSVKRMAEQKFAAENTGRANIVTNRQNAANCLRSSEAALGQRQDALEITPKRIPNPDKGEHRPRTFGTTFHIVCLVICALSAFLIDIYTILAFCTDSVSESSLLTQLSIMLGIPVVFGVVDMVLETRRDADDGRGKHAITKILGHPSFAAVVAVVFIATLGFRWGALTYVPERGAESNFLEEQWFLIVLSTVQFFAAGCLGGLLCRTVRGIWRRTITHIDNPLHKERKEEFDRMARIVTLNTQSMGAFDSYIEDYDNTLAAFLTDCHAEYVRQTENPEKRP